MEIAVCLCARGHMISSIWVGGREVITPRFCGTSGIMLAHLAEQSLSSLSPCDAFCELDLIGEPIKPFHSPVLKFTL